MLGNGVKIFYFVEFEMSTVLAAVSIINLCNFKKSKPKIACLMFATSVFFKVWLEEPLSNFEKALIFFLLFLSILSFVYTIVVAIAVPAQKFWGGNEVLPKFCDVCPNHDFREPIKPILS